MAKVSEVKVLTFGDKAFAVETLSADIQALVEHYNGLLYKDAELRADLFPLGAAMAHIRREIEATYIRDVQAANPAPAPAAPEAPVSNSAANEETV